MEKWMIILLIAAGGYLIGSISFARIVFSRLKPGEEPDRIRTPTTDGQAELVSHAIGATNVMIAFGPRWGLFTTALDIAKAFVPALVLRLLFPAESYHLVAAVAVLVGHLWPVWYAFSGGGGNSSIMGMLLAISPLGLLVTHIGGMIIGKFVPMFAFLGGVALMIPWFAWRNGIFSPEAVFAVVITLLYVAGQLPEARQLRQLKREGHVLEIKHVMQLMKRSAATGQSGAQIMEETTAKDKEPLQAADDSSDH
jgi:glycerol-3-phosphate acyltransferase PlsY